MPPALAVPPPIARAIEQFTADVQRAFGSRLHEVILYGSAARGAMGPESDVDVLIVVDMPEHEAHRIAGDLAFPHFMEHDVLLSPFTIRPERWEEMRRRGKRFAKNVLREGVALA
jgi:predicted nucleotidyltransferase